MPFRCFGAASIWSIGRSARDAPTSPRGTLLAEEPETAPKVAATGRRTASTTLDDTPYRLRVLS
jgi:hypothetical protein